MKTKLILPSRISPLVRLNRLLSQKQYAQSRFFIIVDENTYSHCLPELITHVSALQQADFFEVPVGEEAKGVDVAAQLWGALLESGADRNSVIVNLGGGCVSDIGGFVAAAFKRGIRYVNVPTTLLGMVDAAVGGKTAVNLESVKNAVGFFHAADAVCVEPAFLDTLPESERVAGLFEMTKTFLLSDPEIFDGLVDAVLQSDGVPMDYVKMHIADCTAFKQSVVVADPYERSVRKMLNLGHTFAHGLESFLMTSGSPVSHGVAVGVGMMCSLYLSVRKLGLDASLLDRYVSLVRRLVEVPCFSLRDTEEVLRYIRHDKKNQEGLILCVLLQSAGVPVVDVAVDENEMRDALLSLSKL
ncbi:MAG: 3-dehydroquinate synthase [Bacteroidales bacterium]|nr:3-dehydroquinate synthase [Bacteroidales bacterium]MBR6330654.1 3-dehydroquinate synthase [Bacteroidales bacterium]